MRKAKLIEQLEGMGTIGVRDERKLELTAAAKHSQLRAMVEPLETEWKYVRIEASGRRSEIILTEQSETALRVFGNQKQS